MSSFLSGATAVRVFLSFAAAYFMSFGLRGVNAVLAPDLTSQFGLSNASLGGLTAAYFLGFTAVQLPLGILLDRYGSRRVHSALLLVAALGCAIHAMASSVTWLFLGRALIGAGVGASLMSSYKAYRFWFPPERQQKLVAWMLVAGTCGALTTTVPVQMLAPVIGWRGVFWASAAIILACSFAVFYFLPRDEERASAARTSTQTASLWNGYKRIFGAAFFWRFALFTILFHSSFISLQTLWAGPWCMQVLGLSAQQAAQVLFGFNLVLLAGFLAMGSLVPWLLQRGWTVARIALVSGIGSIAAELFIIGVGVPGPWWGFLVLALIGTAYNTVQPYVGASFPVALSGRALTAYNVMIFGGLFLVQWIYGISVDLISASGVATADAFRYTLLAWLIAQVAGLTVFWLWRPLPPQQ